VHNIRNNSRIKSRRFSRFVFYESVTRETRLCACDQTCDLSTVPTEHSCWDCLLRNAYNRRNIMFIVDSHARVILTLYYIIHTENVNRLRNRIEVVWAIRTWRFPRDRASRPVCERERDPRARIPSTATSYSREVPVTGRTTVGDTKTNYDERSLVSTLNNYARILVVVPVTVSTFTVSTAGGISLHDFGYFAVIDSRFAYINELVTYLDHFVLTENFGRTRFFK